MDKYKIDHDGIVREFDTWIELIYYIKSSNLIDDIAHKYDDVYYYRNPIFYGDNVYRTETTTYYRDCICYDKNNAIINLSEIRFDIKLLPDDYYIHYNRTNKFANIRFRFDPVPGSGKSRTKYCRNIKTRNKNYILGLMDSGFNDSRLMNDYNSIKLSHFYYDDYCYKSYNSSKSWKDSGRLKHQWEKNS